MAQTENQVKDIIATTLIKAWEDDDFKEELLAAPIDTIERLTGERIRFNTELYPAINSQPIFENYVIPIPSYVTYEDVELSEQELDLAAGGVTPNFKSKEEFTNFLESYL